MKVSQKVSNFMEGGYFRERPSNANSVEDCVRVILADLVRTDEIWEFLKVRLSEYGIEDISEGEVWGIVKDISESISPSDRR